MNIKISVALIRITLIIPVKPLCYIELTYKLYIIMERVCSVCGVREMR
jgi:hypothetical protein